MARVGRSISTAIGVIVALGLVGLLVWAFIKGVEADPAVVGPIFAALIGLGVVAYQQTREKKQELERVHRDEMAPIYKTLVEMVKTIDEFVKRPEEELKTFYRDTSTTLLLHGPGPVVHAWVAWNRSLGVSPVSVPLRAQEQLLRAIRTDLGLDNSALQPGDLLRLYLNEEDDEGDRALWQELRSGKYASPSADQTGPRSAVHVPALRGLTRMLLTGVVVPENVQGLRHRPAEACRAPHAALQAGSKLGSLPCRPPY